MLALLPLPPMPEWLCARLPARLPSHCAVPLFNQMFATPLRAGELDFLQNKHLLIEVEDFCLPIALSLRQRQLIAASFTSTAHVTIRGKCYDFFCLATQREDADSLFFHRRLRIEGDTELGVHLKNFLDGFELPSWLAHVQPWLRRLDGSL